MIPTSSHLYRTWRDKYDSSSFEFIHIEVFCLSAVLVCAGQAVSHCYGFGPYRNLRMVLQIT